MDSQLHDVTQWFAGQGDLRSRFGRCFRDAIDELVDCRRTGRYCIEQLGKQEKAFLGVKVETIVRAEFGLAPRSHGKDFKIFGHEVDNKWSIIFGGWQIPREQVGHLCLASWADDNTGELAVGLLRTTEEILNPGKNRDGKRTVRSSALENATTWLVERGPGLPPNFLLHLPKKDREAILSQPGGMRRLFELYTRCEGEVISRRTLAAVGQQIDEARRARGGAGGVRGLLQEAGFELLNGSFKNQRTRAVELGGPELKKGETVCLRTDGTTPQRSALRRLEMRSDLSLF